MRAKAWIYILYFNTQWMYKNKLNNWKKNNFHNIKKKNIFLPTEFDTITSTIILKLEENSHRLKRIFIYCTDKICTADIACYSQKAYYEFRLRHVKIAIILSAHV